MRRAIAALLSVQLVVPSGWGWGAEVHRLVTLLALEDLGPATPGWLSDPAVQRRIAFQSNQPDRWRGWKSLVLSHENDPDHYLDIERLAEFGLTLQSLPKLRREYLVLMVVSRHERQAGPYDVSRDPARTHEWPGFLPYAIAAEYGKLQAAFNQVRIIERLNDPGRSVELEQARAIAIEHAGNLAHFVADATQPLHTTHHYNGWKGPNPAGYRWRERFHAYIDEGVATFHAIDAQMLRPQLRYEHAVDAADPWNDILRLVERSHAKVELLYALERDGRLDGPEGKALIAEQLADAASMLRAMIRAAYESSEPTEEQIARWVRYDAMRVPTTQAQSAPATLPARAP